MAHVRDRPSLRESVEITTPAGNRYRWSDDEDSAANVPSGERFTDSMPGGFAEHEAVLPRKPSVDYADLERLSTITRYDASGGIIWQGRLERAPKVSGDQIAISPSAVGWQAHLEDDKSASMVYIDRDLGRWTGPSRARQVALDALSFHITPGQAMPDTTTGIPALYLQHLDEWASPFKPISEALYDAGAGNLIARIGYDGQQTAAVSGATWVLVLGVADDDTLTSDENTGDIHGGDLSNTFTATTARRFAYTYFYYDATPAGAAGAVFATGWRYLRAVGDHGLTVRSLVGGAGIDAAEEGFYASDVVLHAVSRWAPALTATSDTVVGSTFVIPQLAFHDPTTTGEIVRQATRFGLQDWGVWDDKTFWWHDRGARGQQWRARVGDADLEETGLQVDRLWESVIVQYQDVDGSARTVGPVGSGADTESADLKDDDPDNPANKLGITRRTLLVMGVGTAASATEIGRRFLEESRPLDSSGRARLVGHVQDSHGVWHPYSHVRAGDTISFVDSSDTSYRRIVRTDKTRDDRSCSIDLDAPPEGLAVLLERLGVVLVPLGV